LHRLKMSHHSSSASADQSPDHEEEIAHPVSITLTSSSSLLPHTPLSEAKELHSATASRHHSFHKSHSSTSSAGGTETAHLQAQHITTTTEGR
jgi:hypothetical protein